VSRARIGGILLAAGSARRFGSDKRFALLQAGDTLIARSARVLAQAVDEGIVVVGCDDAPERFAALLPGWQVIRAEDSARGMGRLSRGAGGQTLRTSRDRPCRA